MKEKALILHATDGGLQVFRHYIPFAITPGKKFRNPLYDDRRASCFIYKVPRTGIYRMNDFGDHTCSGDCFWFVAALHGMDLQKDFPRILEKIIRDLSLSISLPESASGTVQFGIDSTQVLHSTPTLAESTGRPYRIEEKAFDESECAYWGQYGITPHVLQRYGVRSLRSFRSETAEGKRYGFMSSTHEPLFGYVRKDYVKIYRPSSATRFVYGGRLPDIYTFGIEQLPQRGDMLFITGGEKDVMSLAAHGFHAICFNSETAEIDASVIEMLVRRFRHVFFLYDADETGVKASTLRCEQFAAYNVRRIELPLAGTKAEKDISDYFRLGYSAEDFHRLIADRLERLYAQTLMLLDSCEIDYCHPPDRSQTVIASRGVPLGTYDNLFCITGGEGTGKSNYVSALIAGTLLTEIPTPPPDLLGLEVTPNASYKAVLHYDTEQSEYQLHRNVGKTLRRVGLDAMPTFYHPVFLAALSRKDRLQLIKDSLDLYHHRHGGIHLVVIDGIADLIRSANDEAESIAVVDELYRLAGIYHTCILCVLHFVPNGIKLRGHIGSELQRKSAAILSIEKDDNPALSVVKALKVRDGSPLDVPIMLFGWDKERDMHVSRGEKSEEERERRKTAELSLIAREVFRERDRLSHDELLRLIMQTVEVKERTAKDYIRHMQESGLIEQQKDNHYTLKK